MHPGLRDRTPDIEPMPREHVAAHVKWGWMGMIAEVIQVAETSNADPSEIRAITDEAAPAPGSEQLLILTNSSTGEGLVVHVWRGQAALEAYDEQRRRLVARAQAAGGTQGDSRVYEVAYNS
jgi:hypothetical protein